MGQSNVASWLGGGQRTGGRRCSYRNVSFTSFSESESRSMTYRLVRSRHIVASQDEQTSLTISGCLVPGSFSGGKQQHTGAIWDRSRLGKDALRFDCR